MFTVTKEAIKIKAITLNNTELFIGEYSDEKDF